MLFLIFITRSEDAMHEVVVEKAVAGDAPLLAEIINKLFDIEKDFLLDFS